MSASYKTEGAVTLTEEQIVTLHQKLREMRHDVNGQLTNIIAAAELIRLRPESTEQRLQTLLDLRPGAPALARASYLQELHGDLTAARATMEKTKPSICKFLFNLAY